MWRRGARTGKAERAGEPSPELESLNQQRQTEADGETSGLHEGSTRLWTEESKKARAA